MNIPPERLLGRKVRLKSGGPDMVISEVLAGDKVVCQWFCGDDLQIGTLNLCLLEPMEPREAPRHHFVPVIGKATSSMYPFTISSLNLTV
mgnify:CR=1 FL=1